MIMSPRLRKLVLTAHIISSVGWLGAVAGFLALAIAGLTSPYARTVCASYLAMELTARFVIVPLSLASPLTGIVQSLGTMWGLFRHYWVLVKFLITIPSTIVLLVHMQPIGHLARVVAETTLSSGDLAGMRIQLVAASVAALLVLLVATVLSVYKPKGMVPYGQREQYEHGGTGDDTGAEPSRRSTASTPRWMKVSGIIVIALVLLFVILHLTNNGLGGH